MIEEIYSPVDALYGVGADERDFILGRDVNVLDLAPVQDDIHFFYNQYELLGGQLSHFCSGMSPIHTICSIYNYEMTQKDRESYRKYAQEKYGYKAGFGNLLQTGVLCAVNWWNGYFPTKKVTFLQIPELISMDVMLAWDKKYGVCTGYRGDSAYNRDRDDNGVVDGVRFGSNYGHGVPIFKKKLPRVHDSFKGRKTNEYDLRDIGSLRRNGVYFPTAYIIVPDPDLQLKETILKARQQFLPKIEEHMTQNGIMRNEMGNYPEIGEHNLGEIRNALHNVNNIYRRIIGK